jgi:DNA-binding CsgD family transcriptional regulator
MTGIAGGSPGWRPRVEIREPIASLRGSLAKCLASAGLDSCADEDSARAPDLRIWTLGPPDDAGRHPYCGAVPLIALLDQPTSDAVGAALSFGASGVVRRASDAVVAAAAIAVLGGYLVVPRSSGVRRSNMDSLALLDRDELRFMRSLAGGSSVRSLARRESFSEREMHRRLSGIYEKLGASGRAEALVLLARADLLRDRSTDHGEVEL